ncbi:hypothetical protein, partial [Ruegeria arenilitoris]|uniref:hypothetical protein n=1 Tax=Ruegeria arenilitoris TaxID=1173585 RepID=UPI00147F4E1B
MKTNFPAPISSTANLTRGGERPLDAWPASMIGEMIHTAIASDQLVQKPISYKDNNTTYAANRHISLRSQTMGNLIDRLMQLGLRPSASQLLAINDVATTLEKMAEAKCEPSVYLSSLDPGVGKTTTLIEFLKCITSSDDHHNVGVLVCVSRLSEVGRLFKEAGLNDEDFAVLTADSQTNRLSNTDPSQAQVLITTQQMLAMRCAGGSFSHCRDFHYLGEPRQVRVWDETLEPGEVVSLSSDDAGSLLPILRPVSSELADQVQSIQEQLISSQAGTTFQLPKIDPGLLKRAIGVANAEDAKRRLEALASLSGRVVRVASGMGRQRIALDIRDALPSDLVPLLVLDASGRVRQTYSHWEKQRGTLKRLRSAPKSYDQLIISVLDQGGGKDSWHKNGDQLAMEVATLVDSKPDEEWLVIHHKDARGVDPKDLICSYMQTDPSRVHFLHWGAHQATNEFKDIQNVVLAGTLFLPESHYEGLSYASTGRSLEEALPCDLIANVRLGEYGHAVLQALCRASVRGSDGSRCLPCNAYIIASPKSGIRKALTEWFPGCRIKTWRPAHKPLRGKVGDAVDYIQRCLQEDPTAPIYFSELMDAVGIADRSNFNRTIRKNESFLAPVEALGLIEVKIGKCRGNNALQRLFGPVERSDY